MKLNIVAFLLAFIIFTSHCCFVKSADLSVDSQELPYKLETLANINTKYSLYYDYSWHTLANDIFYYIDTVDKNTSVINSVNTITFEKNEVFRTGIKINYDNKDYSVIKIGHIFYDNNNDRVISLIKADYESNVSPDSKDFLVDVIKKEVICICPYNSNRPNDYVPYYVDEDNYMWMNLRQNFDKLDRYYNFNGNSKQGVYGSNIYGCIDGNLVNKKDVLFVFGTYGIEMFDYKNYNKIYSSSSTCYGWNKDGIIICNSDLFFKTDYDMKEKYQISESDISVKDKKTFILNRIAYKMYLNSHNEIIFYDTMNYAIRKIGRVIINTSHETSNGYRFTTNHENDFEDISYLGGTVIASLFDKKTNTLKEVKFVDFKGAPIDFNFNNDKDKTYVKILWVDLKTLSPKTNIKTIGR